MAKYNVNHSCGHTGEHSLVGPHKERERKLEWLETQPCWECRKAARDKERAAASGVAAKEAEGKGLPKLEGSPKQIAWAESIRKDFFDNPLSNIAISPSKEEYMLSHSEEFGTNEVAIATKMGLLKSRLSEINAKVTTTTNAKWWIDNRENLISLVKKQAEQALQEVFAEEIAFQESEKGRKAEAQRQEQEAKREKIVEDEKKRKQEQEVESAKATSFRVGDRPEAVKLSEHGDSFTVRAIDGRVAHGFIDGGEWVVYMIGDNPIDSSHPEIERIAREAKDLHKKPRTVVATVVKQGSQIAKVTKKQETRSTKAQIADNAKQAKITVSIDKPDLWLKNPNRVDISGIDTPRVKGKLPQQRGPGLLLPSGKLVKQRRGSVL